MAAVCEKLNYICGEWQYFTGQRCIDEVTCGNCEKEEIHQSA